MRTIKELLTIMLENKGLFSTGLCLWACDVAHRGLINPEEYYVIVVYIKANKPFTIYRMFAKLNYYWRPQDIYPRIRWIKRHIKKNS